MNLAELDPVLDARDAGRPSESEWKHLVALDFLFRGRSGLDPMPRSDWSRFMACWARTPAGVGRPWPVTALRPGGAEGRALDPGARRDAAPRPSGAWMCPALMHGVSTQGGGSRGGKRAGAIRVSLGLATNIADVFRFVQFAASLRDQTGLTIGDITLEIESCRVIREGS